MSMFYFYRQAVLRSVIPALLLLLFASTGYSAASTQKETDSDYRLGVGDRILISVYGENDLTIETQLSDSGVINYPFLGEIKIVNLKLSELEALIVNGLKGDYLVSPSVNVAIIEYRPFFIKGEVKNPGGYPYQPGLTLGKAAALAGGFTERASESKTYIVRGDDPSQTAAKANLNTRLRPGDIVTVEQSFF